MSMILIIQNAWMEGYGNHIVVFLFVCVYVCVCVYVKTTNIGGATGRLQKAGCEILCQM